MPHEHQDEFSPSSPLARRRAAKPNGASTELVEYQPTELPGRGSYAYGEQDEGFDLREFLRKVYRHRWMLLTIVVVTTTVAALVMYRAKSTYQAATILEVGKDSTTLIKANDLVLENEDSDSATGIKTKMLMFRSQELLEDVVVDLKLNQNSDFLGEPPVGLLDALRGARRKKQEAAEPTPEPVTSSPSDGGPRPADERARLSPYVGLLEGGLEVEQIRETRAIRVAFTHPDPQVAAAVSDGLAQAFIRRNYEGKTERFTNTQAWLDRSTAELKAKVEKAEQALADYTRRNGIFSTEGKSTLTTDKLTRLHDQATRAETDRLLKETLYEEVRRGRVAQLPQAFAQLTDKSQPKVVALQKQLDDLLTEESKLSVRYGPDHPQMQETREQIGALRGQLEAGRRELEETLKLDYERAVSDERALKAALEGAKGEAVHENQAAIAYNILLQDVTTAKSLYTEFLQKANQSRIKLAEQYSNIRVIDHAKVPVAPNGPKRLFTTLCWFFLSVAAGLGLIYLREMLDNTVKHMDDVTRYTQLATLAVIPVFKPNEKGSPLDFLKQRFERGIDKGDKGDNGAHGTLEGGRGNFSPALARKRPYSFSAISEAYLNLRTSMLLSTAGGPPRTVLVTSGDPGDGKSTTAINAAISLGQVGATVLIVDADLRRPSLHQVLGVDNKRGLSTYLSGKAMLADLIQPLPYPNLALLPSGPVPPNPTNLISSSKMQKMLEILSEHYDYILIDSPPLINLADAVVLSTLVDGVVVVARSGRTTRDTLRRARRELTGVGANVIGVVLNCADLKRDGYYNYQYYYYR
jgi:polysaccharide biosynthesis transport protein